MSHQDSREKSIGRIARLVALSPIFTKHVNLHWGIVPNSREWCTETDPSILQHNRAPSQLLSRFSPINHWDSHFSEESLEKVTFLTSKRPSISSIRQESWNFWTFWTFWTSKVVGRRPARGIAERISRFDCGEFLKLHQWQITANWVLNLLRSERWWRGVFRISVPVYYLLEHSLSKIQMCTFHFALHAIFSSGFWYGMYHVVICTSSLTPVPVLSES